MTTIAVDVTGGDHGPNVTVPAALAAAAEGMSLVLVGNERAVPPDLHRAVHEAGLPLVDAPNGATPGAPARAAGRDASGSPYTVAADLVRSGDADAMVTMGDTGTAMATAIRRLGRLPGVERPALAVLLPGGPAGTLLLDAGANADVRPGHLHQFARLGSIYMEAVLRVSPPRVALLSIGEEPSKGSTMVVESHRILAEDPSLHFIGNIEGRDLLSGAADVVVTDGFTGNVAVKLIEGVAARPFRQIRDAANTSLRARLGALLLRPVLAGMRDELSARRYGAVPLIGVNGGVFIGHGRSDTETVTTAIRAAHLAMERGMLEAFHGAVAEQQSA